MATSVWPMLWTVQQRYKASRCFSDVRREAQSLVAG